MNRLEWRNFLLQLMISAPLEENYAEFESRVVRQVGLFFDAEEVVLRKPDEKIYGREVHARHRQEDRFCPESFEDYLIHEAAHMLPRLIDEKHMTRVLLTLLDPDGTMMYLEAAWYLAAGTKSFDWNEMVRFNRALAQHFIHRGLQLRSMDSVRSIHQVVHHLPLGVAVLDRDGRIEYTNPALEASVASGRNEILSRHCSDVICNGNAPAEACPLFHADGGSCAQCPRIGDRQYTLFRVARGSNGNAREKVLLVASAPKPQGGSSRTREEGPRHPGTASDSAMATAG